jgi:uncharacterized membrane protein YccC
MTAEQLQLIAETLQQVARTLAVVAIAQSLSEVSSPEERAFLSEALSNLISNYQGASQRLGRDPRMSYGDQRMF